MAEVILENAEDTQKDIYSENGNIRISGDVVAAIAGIAANEIKGVAGMCGTITGGIVEFLGNKKNPGKGVKVDVTDDTAIIDMFVIVEYGIRIPELAWEIQENVKASVESMTGLTVEKVNIHIDGVNFEKDQKKKKDNSSIIIDEINLEDIPENGSESL